MHFNCDFHPCALSAEERRHESPLVCCQWCGLYQFMYRSSPRSLYFNCQSVRIDRRSVDMFLQLLPRMQESDPPFLQSCIGHKISYVYNTRALSFPPTFQLVELDLGLVGNQRIPYSDGHIMKQLPQCGSRNHS